MPQELPRRFQQAPKRVQEASKIFQKASRDFQDASKIPQRSFQAPRSIFHYGEASAASERAQRAKRAERTIQEAARWIHDGPITLKCCHSELLKRTALPVPCQIRFMLGLVLRATEALLALRFPGFSCCERSQDESVMGLVLGGVLEASWSDVGRLLGGQDGVQDGPRLRQEEAKMRPRRPKMRQEDPKI